MLWWRITRKVANTSTTVIAVITVSLCMSSVRTAFYSAYTAITKHRLTSHTIFG
ncbi:hypothetical protein Bca52824_040533 [Brassica carinata]|uniref:Uncharacterized protein n=1 Tax=Brassica carinata TaxID=52824 RepID=A0A8X7UX08_BRACI|nr:hypothetical protein Bca52824_040533 [Brassica carinata]